MKLLVTGGLGFIGSNFILRTLEKYPDFKITNIDACLPGSNLKNLPKLNKKNYLRPMLMGKELLRCPSLKHLQAALLQ